MKGEKAEEMEPRDAKVAKELLRSMGIGEGEYEPRVINQFLELCYSYVVDVLSDAQLFSDHGGKTSIDPDDVKLAIQSKVNFSFSQPPPREVLLELARRRNKFPLPKSIAEPGIPLPPEQDTLISPNYQLLVQKKHAPQAVGEMEVDEDGSNPNPNPSFSQQQSAANTDDQQKTPKRVSFPLAAAAAAKRPR